MAAGPDVPVGDEPPGRSRVVRASSRLISGMVNGMMPARRAAGRDRTGVVPGHWLPARSLRRAAVTAQMARAAMTSTACRAIAV